MPTGITRYIASLAPAPQMTGAGRRPNSIRHGIQVDNCVRRLFAGQNRRVRPTVRTAAKLFFQELRRAGVRLVATQHRVTNSARSIATHLDGLGVTEDGKDTAVELKTSLYPLAVYQKHYQTTMPAGARELLPGMPNTLYWRHQLQAGFGAHCLGPGSKGLVVVVCPDGAMSHWVQSAATKERNFARPMPAEAPKVRLLKWPGHDAVKHVVKGVGRARNPVKAGVAHYTGAVVGAVSPAGTKRAALQREKLKHEARKRGVRAYVVQQGENGLQFLTA